MKCIIFYSDLMITGESGIERNMKELHFKDFKMRSRRKNWDFPNNQQLKENC